jgi:transcriptional regulator with XRE-family HTH domain
MKKSHVLLLKNVGVRFLLFRKAIKRTVQQLASELKTSGEEIKAIEKGMAYPKVNYLHYLHEKYGLSINWLVTNIGDMFIDDAPPDLHLDSNYVFSASSGDGNEALKKKYLELVELMQIPEIEKALLAKLEEIKNCLNEEE